jgi:hypothetical protein
MGLRFAYGHRRPRSGPVRLGGESGRGGNAQAREATRRREKDEGGLDLAGLAQRRDRFGSFAQWRLHDFARSERWRG